jgi:hypothetical protein
LLLQEEMERCTQLENAEPSGAVDVSLAHSNKAEETTGNKSSDGLFHSKSSSSPTKRRGNSHVTITLDQPSTVDSGLDPGHFSMGAEFLKDLEEMITSMDRERILKEQCALELHSYMAELPYVHFKNGQSRVSVPVPFQKEFKGCGTAI